MNENRLAADIRCKVVAWVLHLAFVAQENPICLEDVFQFGFEQSLIEVNLPVDAKNMIVGAIINQFTHVRRGSHPIHSVSPYSAAEAMAAV